MDDQGNYTDKFSGHKGQGLVAYFFEPAVLDRFRNDPNYKVTDSMVSSKEDSQADSSWIQQYMWGRKADGQPCIAVLLRHLRFLSSRDQLHWRSFELPSHEAAKAKIEARYRGPMLNGDFPDTISCYQAIFFYLRETQKVFAPDLLLPNVPDTLPSFLAPLPFNSKKAMASFAQDLLSLMSINFKVLSSRLNQPANRAKAVELLERQQSRNLIGLYFEDHGLFSQGIENALAILRELNDWRVKSAHKLVPVEQDQDYLTMQAELVSRLQRGLREMLLAFMKAESKTPDWTCERILDYSVG
jgi:hypothetical protein